MYSLTLQAKNNFKIQILDRLGRAGHLTNVRAGPGRAARVARGRGSQVADFARAQRPGLLPEARGAAEGASNRGAGELP